MEMTGIYRKLYYKKQGPYIIIEVFKNGTFRVQQGKLNKHINMIGLKPHFDEYVNWCPYDPQIFPIWGGGAIS